MSRAFGEAQELPQRDQGRETAGSTCCEEVPFDVGPVGGKGLRTERKVFSMEIKRGGEKMHVCKTTRSSQVRGPQDKVRAADWGLPTGRLKCQTERLDFIPFAVGSHGKC